MDTVTEADVYEVSHGEGTLTRGAVRLVISADYMRNRPVLYYRFYCRNDRGFFFGCHPSFAFVHYDPGYLDDAQIKKIMRYMMDLGYKTVLEGDQRATSNMALSLDMVTLEGVDEWQKHLAEIDSTYPPGRAGCFEVAQQLDWCGCDECTEKHLSVLSTILRETKQGWLDEPSITKNIRALFDQQPNLTWVAEQISNQYNIEDCHGDIPAALFDFVLEVCEEDDE